MINSHQSFNSHKKIVLIDDDEDDQETFRMALNEVDPSMDCTCYYSGAEALSKLTEPDSVLPEYIFLDLNMPVMSGVQFLEKIKTTPLAELPVVIYATDILPRQQEKVEKLGVLDVLLKPVSDSELVRRIKNFFVTNLVTG
jgi:CheY-like chemotaxis protein